MQVLARMFYQNIGLCSILVKSGSQAANYGRIRVPLNKEAGEDR